MTHNKLVRDRIPEIISQTGNRPVTRILDRNEYRRELARKLCEEAGEFAETGRIEELADVLEVVRALAAAGGIAPEELEAIRLKKRQQRGGFDGRTFLIEVRPGEG